MCYLLICIVIAFLFFFAGRAYQMLFLENINQYQNHVNYQKRLFEEQIEINRQKGEKLDAFFVNRNIRRIVIYGLGPYYQEFLHDVSVQIFDEIFFSDGNPEACENEGKIYSKMELLQLDFDAVIVTSLSHYLDIREDLLKLGIEQDIYSYSDIVYNSSKER